MKKSSLNKRVSLLSVMALTILGLTGPVASADALLGGGSGGALLPPSDPSLTNPFAPPSTTSPVSPASPILPPPSNNTVIQYPNSVLSSIDGASPQFDWSKASGLGSSLTPTKTLDQALAWANSQKGQGINYDNAYGNQCVDLTMAYAGYLFGIPTMGNASDYAVRDYTGFTRLSKSQTTPKAGDIAVWTGGPGGYGHVGIVTASSGTNFTTLEQNVSGSPVVQQFSRDTGNLYDLTFWGVQRPTLVAQAPAPTPVPEISYGVYRLYNPGNGDHLYTTSNYEANSLRAVGWQYDGVTFHASSTGVQVYRVYNPNSGEHLYTISIYEYNNLVKAGWSGEGNAWLAPNIGNDVFRVYNPNGFHVLTGSQDEVNRLVSLGWRNEGVVFKG